MFWVAVVILIVALDQVAKYAVAAGIEYGRLIPVIDGFFYLTRHENAGAAWGIFQNGRYFFIAAAVIASVFICYYMFRLNSRFLKAALSFILGGAFGNLVDRVLKGSVVDFLDFYFGKFHFPTFNVADSFITVGSILLAVYMLFVYKEKESGKKNG